MPKPRSAKRRRQFEAVETSSLARGDSPATAARKAAGVVRKTVERKRSRKARREGRKK